MVQAKIKGQKKVTHTLRPEALTAQFANSFAVEASNDDVTIAFGQKSPLGNPNEDIHNINQRIIMTRHGFEVFFKLLQDSMTKLQKTKKSQ